MTASTDDYVGRSDVDDVLKKILTDPNVDCYWIVSGEHGTGKTTTVQNVCREIGKGIIYVDIPENIGLFNHSFAQAIGVFYHQQDDGWLSYFHKFYLGPEQGI